jgi:hypothetical protein
MSGAIYDLTGSYPTAFLNGIAKDLLNITRSRDRKKHVADPLEHVLHGFSRHVLDGRMHPAR